MFADDTTVFLSEEDDFHTLQSILERWCLASGAKFNVEKTEIVPIGNRQYRDELRATRGAANGRDGIPPEINIAREREPVRALGAFVGNGVEDVSVWTPTIEAVDAALKRWKKTSPTLEGKRLIINMEVGGRTQYRTTVQGMPAEVLQHLKKLVREFLWDGKASYVNIDTLHLPFGKGGLKILDLEARNESIRLMRLKRYLDFTRRPRWAFIADYLLARNIPKSYGQVNPDDLVNMYLQSWNAAKKTNKSVAPQPIREMMKTAEKYGARMWTNHPSESLKRAMPAWFHIASKRSAAGSNATNCWTRCQKERHKIETMGDLSNYALEAQSHELATGGDERDPPVSCTCERCELDRSLGCIDPIKCREHALLFLGTINKTWIPNNERNERVEGTLENHRGRTPLNRANDFTSAMRIFTSSEAVSTTEDVDLNALFSPSPDYTAIEEEIYTDGSCKTDGEQTVRAGSGIWFGDDDERNMAFRIPQSLPQTNNIAEGAAILAAVQAMRDDIPVIICSDSQVTLTVIGKSALKAEDTDWLETKNREVIEPIIAKLRLRKGLTIMEKVKAHVGIHGNEMADRLADQGADKDVTDVALDMEIPARQKVEGMRLDKASQALIYRGIRRLKTRNTAPRRTTQSHLEAARHEIRERTKKTLTDEQIWMSFRNNDIRNRRTKQLLWKIMHQGLPIGTYWDKITNYEGRSRCKACVTVESAEHIFTECTHNGQKTVWKIVTRIFEKKNIPWTTPTLGTILGCGVTHIMDARTGKPRPEANRLYTMVVAEAIQFIWRSRCTWIIDRDGEEERAFTEKEIHNKFLSSVNRVLKFDIDTTSYKPKKNKNRRRLNIPTEDLVINTWWDVVDSNTDLEWEVMRKNRRKRTGVLVGIRPR
ncbi:hypothetical protein D9611_005971 [Ephemerocybe angulata]|uniref:ribonuclease H n=1 Tax=Ephemerocybe angulata TaxID=980116 RepID=A0A8H5FLJ3_9AGAR|nr:hypothetical protein D9611_005971 [Tulosesus angulatus]